MFVFFFFSHIKRRFGRLGGSERGAVVAGGGVETVGGKHAREAAKGGGKTSSTGGGRGGIGEGKEGQEGEKICGRRRRRRRSGADGQGARKHAEGGARQVKEAALMTKSCLYCSSYHTVCMISYRTLVLVYTAAYYIRAVSVLILID